MITDGYGEDKYIMNRKINKYQIIGVWMLNLTIYKDYILISFMFVIIISNAFTLLTISHLQFYAFCTCLWYMYIHILYSDFVLVFVLYSFLSILYCIIKERTFGLVSTFLHLPFLFTGQVTKNILSNHYRTEQQEVCYHQHTAK